MQEYVLVFSKDSNREKSSKIISNFSLDYIETKFNYNVFCDYYKTREPILDKTKLDIRNILSSHKVDILFLPLLLDATKPSLFVFDMDSTLIQQEVIDEIAKENGVYEEVSKVTLEAMEGKLNFDEALKKRCELLKGISTETFERVYSRLQLNLGVEFFLKNRKNYLIKVAVLSGGFEPILQRFQREYRIEFFKANLLEEENQILTGKVLGEIINAEKKEKYLLEIAQKERIPLSQVVAIGDGSNDSLMLNRAGIGIGFHAKDGLKRKIQNWIEYFGMEILFFLFGSKT